MSKQSVEDDSLMGDVAAAQLRIRALEASKDKRRQKALEEAAKIKEKWGKIEGGPRQISAVELQRAIILIAKSAGIHEVNAGSFEQELQEKMKKPDLQARSSQTSHIRGELSKIVDKFVSEPDLPITHASYSREVGLLLNLKTKDLITIKAAFAAGEGLEPETRKAAIKIALYHRLFPKEEAVEQTADIIAEHLFRAPKEKKVLEKAVRSITSSIINKSNPLEVKALQDTARTIAEAKLEKPAPESKQSPLPTPLQPALKASTSPVPQKNSSLSLKEKIKNAWGAFVDILPSFRKVNKIGVDLQGLIVATPLHQQPSLTPVTPQRAHGSGQLHKG